MVATELLEYFNKFQGLGQVGIEDFADKLNSIYSVILLIICGLIITVKQYFMTPLTCFTATKADGENFGDFVDNYCWVEGTIYVPPGRSIPNDDDDWKRLEEKKLYYYQWVPFVLALQCVLFIIPRFLWQMLTYNRTGTDLENLVKMASEATTANAEKQKKKVQHITATIQNIIFATRDVRRGKVSDFRRRLHNVAAFSVVSKRLGTWVTAIYLLMKLLYLSNSIGQIYMMQRFLGLQKNYTYFGAQIARDIVLGRDWQQTEVFPRVTFCRVPIQLLGSLHYYTSQCVLGINFLNEKIYIFLWFWLVIVSLISIISIPVWLLRLLGGRSRTRFIKKNLLLRNNFQGNDELNLDNFICQYLRHDGLFILRMLALNAGDLITSEVVSNLWDAYKEVNNLLNKDTCNDRREGEVQDRNMNNDRREVEMQDRYMCNDRCDGEKLNRNMCNDRRDDDPCPPFPGKSNDTKWSYENEKMSEVVV